MNVAEESNVVLYELMTYFLQIRGQNTEEVKHVIEILKRQPMRSDGWNTQDDPMNTLTMVLSSLVMSYTQYPAHILERSQHIIIEFPDKGTTCVQIFYPTMAAKISYEESHPHHPNPPGLYLFPGITQTSISFKNIIVECIDKRGLPVVVVNRRGLCERLTTPTFHIAGSDEDTQFVLQTVYRMPYFQGRQMFALGISIGGELLSRYLGNQPNIRHLDGIIAASTICSPILPCDVVINNPMINYKLTRSLYDIFASSYVNYRYYWEPGMKTSWVKKMLCLFRTPTTTTTAASSIVSNTSENEPPAVIRQRRRNKHHEAKTKKNQEYDEQQQQQQQQQQPTQVNVEEIAEAYRIRNLYKVMKFCNNVYEIMYANLVMLEDPEQKHPEYRKMMDEYGPERFQQMIRDNNPIVWSIFEKKHSAAPQFHRINVPILVIHSSNDPIVRVSERSKQIITSCPNSIHLQTKFGSHCCYRQPNHLMDVLSFSWIDALVFDFFDSKTDAVY